MKALVQSKKVHLISRIKVWPFETVWKVFDGTNYQNEETTLGKQGRRRINIAEVDCASRLIAAFSPLLRFFLIYVNVFVSRRNTPKSDPIPPRNTRINLTTLRRQ